MQNTKYGTKEIYNKRDYIFKGDIIEKARGNFETSGKIQYHQKGNSCFLFGPLGAVSDLTGLRFSKEDENLLMENAWKSKYADPKWGGYFWYGVKSVIDLFNVKYSKKGEHLEYYKIPMSEFEKFLEKGYSIICGYKNTKKLVADKRDDGILNFSGGEYTGTDKGNGHCVRMAKINGENKIINNYSGMSNMNIYGIENFEKEKDNGIFFGFGYIVVIKDGVKDGYEGLSLEEKLEKLRNRPEAIKKREELLKKN